MSDSSLREAAPEAVLRALLGTLSDDRGGDRALAELVAERDRLRQNLKDCNFRSRVLAEKVVELEASTE